MNWEQAKGQWTQMKGSVRKQWGKLTDDDLDVINGERERLVGKIQERYGIAKEEAERQTANWNPSDVDSPRDYQRKAG
ncbi:MAG: CsbD family protein [Terriglobales bacterium]